MTHTEMTYDRSFEFLTRCVLCGASVDRRKASAQIHLKSLKFKANRARRSNESLNRPAPMETQYEIFQCKECGLQFINPRDNQETVCKQYLDDVTSPVSYYAETAKIDAVNFIKRFDWIEAATPSGRLLDVGCNVGTFLEIAQNRGWQVAGIEPNKKAIDICLSKGIPVFQGFLSDDLANEIERNPFDVVALNDSIEHFPDPLATMRLVHRLVRPGGVVAISTPNIRSILTNMFQIKPKEHLFYFDAATLTALLERAGFKVQLLVETGRRRDIGSAHHGATLDSEFWNVVSRLLDVTRLDKPVSILLERLFKEELFVLAQKA